jgi:ribosomal protein S18 acetylase RimI-like enzyme
VDADALLRRVLAGTCGFARVLASELHELDGVRAAVLPACPERSVMNSVCYDSAAQLAAALDDVAAIYDDAAIQAWTVWVPPADREAAGLLGAAGHDLDAAPEAMGMDLSAAERPLERLDWTRRAELDVVGRLNDRAYGYDGSFERALEAVPADLLTAYAANLDGQAASCCATLQCGSDCHVTLVATVPEARGRGLAGTLLRHALADARERGLETSSLVATKAGRPLYERLGYRGVGAVEMWERRRG